MMINSKQLKSFAEACGWKCEDPPHTDYPLNMQLFHNPNTAEKQTLPDFFHSKDAVIEALEYFCEKRKVWFQIHQTAKRQFIVSLSNTVDEIAANPTAAPFNEAIIIAVLSTISEGRSK